MMLGRETRLPGELWVPIEEQKPTSPVENVSDLESALETAHKLARQTLKTELKKAKSGWDVRSRVVGFEAGQMVFCLNKAAKNKLAPKWVGPFVVIERIMCSGSRKGEGAGDQPRPHEGLSRGRDTVVGTEDTGGSGM